ncbi:hypothetical protein J7394_19775 [Ruegeria sp. R13_0]|uniref:hypothetical protein n=1 Tax=Ruegeria sp. R13_0 TaxID=2821099 RepID=UPI001ADA9893|nr:hypothetical protein [Ruegeria sp. R13_0]MBO9436463.1 hypothetical protein [Ruegeria sp. R13_0]
MQDEKTGRFLAAVPVSRQLVAQGVPERYVSQSKAIEEGRTKIKAYLRKPALTGMARFFQLAADRGLPMEFEANTIIVFLDDLDERSTGSSYWLRFANAMQEVAREMGFPFDIVDGFEVRLGQR